MVPQFPTLSQTLTGPPIVVLLGILGLFPLCILAAFGLMTWSHRRRALRRFRGRATAAKLTRNQYRLAVQLVKHGGLKDPVSLLTLLGVFDRQVASFLSVHLSGDPRTDRKMLKTLSGLRRQLGFDALKVYETMRTTRQLARGQRLFVQPNGTANNEIPCAVDHRDDGAITVVPVFPEHRRRFPGLRRGASLAVELRRNEDSKYRFNTEVLAVDARKRAWKLAHAEKVDRLQLRSFYRLEAHDPVTLFAFPMTPESFRALKPEEINWDLGEPIGGLITNISAGGMSVVTDDPPHQGDVIVVDPGLKGRFPLAGLPCELVSESSEGRKRTLRLCFHDLQPAEEAAIVRSLHRSLSEAKKEFGLGEETSAAQRAARATDDASASDKASGSDETEADRGADEEEQRDAAPQSAPDVALAR